MLDPKYIRENLEMIKEGARKKKVNTDIDRWVELDDERKKVQGLLDEKRAEQNEASAKIGQADAEHREEMIAAVGEVKGAVQKTEEQMKEIMVE